MAKYTFADLLQAIRILGNDTDIYIDNIGSVAYCGTELTEAGKIRYKDALSLPINGTTVISDSEEDYDLAEDEEGSLYLAYRMLLDMAGYCPCWYWDQMFKNE